MSATNADMQDEHDEQSSAPAAASSSAGAGANAALNKKKKAKAKAKKAAAAAAAAGGDSMDTSSGSSDSKDAEAEKWLESLKAEDILNPQLLDPAFVAKLTAEFHAGKPFKHLCIPSLLDPSFLRTLENELRGLEYYSKSSDLFEFAQSGDLKGVTTPLVSKLKQVLYGATFRKILQTITGIEIGQLAETVDMSANVYGDTNTLLCHDDELLGRRIAYILYFVPPSWSAADGGSLDLFDTDGEGQPREIVKSLVPAWNNFSFFEVSPVSFHQVREVTLEDPEAVEESTGQNRVRLSVSGWYHGAPIVRPPPPAPVVLDFVPLARDTSFKLEEWLAPEYLKPKNIAKIAAQFQQESSIELAAFLAKDKYATLMDVLQGAPEEAWKHVGPANKQNFDAFAKLEKVKTNSTAASSAASASSSSSAAAAAASSSSAPSSVSASSASSFLSSLHSFLTSAVFGTYLGGLTGLEYLSSAGCVRRFCPGAYTLAHSENEERFEEAVDINLCAINPAAAGLAGKKNRWDAAVVGGSTHYIEEGEQDELMSLSPKANTLSIVYRAGIPAGPEREEAVASSKGGVIKFVKYINHRANQNKFDFDYIFRIQPTIDDDDEEEEEEEEEVKPPPKKKQAATKGKK